MSANGGKFVKRVDSGRELSRSVPCGVPEALTAGEAPGCGEGVSGDGVSKREGGCDTVKEPDSGLLCWAEL